MSSEWSFTVEEAPGDAFPLCPSGFVTLDIVCRLELFPTEKEPKPQLVENLRKRLYVPLEKPRRDGDFFFTRIFTKFPPVVHIENLDIHGVAGRVISLSTTAVALKVSLKVVRVMPSAEIERVTFEGWMRRSGLFLVPRVDKKELCSICLEEIGFRGFVKTACTHIHHSRCLFGWLKENKTCPVCRCILR